MRASFLLLILIVLAAGCVNPLDGVTGGGGPGVVINSFSFSPSNLKSNQLTKLSLSIENRGDYAIEDNAGVVYLFNLPNDWELTDKSETTSKIETFSLMAPQTQGAKRYSVGDAGFEWILRAPLNLPKDEIFSYIAQARVCYPYKTKVWGRLEVVSEDAWLQKPPAEHTIAAQQTQGPIKVEFISRQPLMAETDVRIKVRITNIGDGVVTTNDCSVFENSGEDTDNADERINELNHITLAEGDCVLGDSIYLKKGQTKDTYITCTPPALGNNPITTSDFTMELTYNYYLDKKATVSVTGTSEDASGGMIGGGGGVITLTDMATKLCGANGQKNGEFAMGMCRPESESNAIAYPPGNTFGFQVMLEALGLNELNMGTGPITREAFIAVLGGDAKYNAALIKDLKLHDARLGDFSGAPTTTKTSEDKTLAVNGLLDWTISDLDSSTFNSKYTQKMLEADTDMDGLPDWFEEQYSSNNQISATSKDANNNGLQDPNEIYKGSVTYAQQYASEKGTALYLGIAKYLCDKTPTGIEIGKDSGGNTIMGGCSADKAGSIPLINLAGISFNGKEYKPLTNGADVEALRNLPADNLKITAIDGYAISAIAQANPSRKIRSAISDISIGEVYVNRIPAATNLQNFLKYSRCSDKTTVYSRSVVAKCLRDTSKKLKSWLQTSASTQCDMTCKNTFNLNGGACTAPYAASPICKGSSVVEIGGFNTAGKFGCTDTCTCYGKTLATLSIQDAALVCEKAA